MPVELENALNRKGITEPYAYLSNSVSMQTAKNRIWRAYGLRRYNDRYRIHDSDNLVLYEKDSRKVRSFR